jgi:type IV pilus assembly protein PilW
MKTIKQQSQTAQRGFSMIEIMVGMVIGLLASIVIVQIMSKFENNKRVTTGSADAQTNGAIALFNLERELQMAGYPLTPSTTSPLKCTTLTIDGVVDVTTAKRITPVIITDGGATGNDSITVRYGNSGSGGVPAKITAVAGNDITLESNFGCKKDDITLITVDTSCAISKISQAVVLGTGNINVDDTTLAAGGANLSCLGTWDTVLFAINNGNLERNGVPIVTEVVGLQAQYGISAQANSNTIVNWVNATGIWDANALTVANRNLIKGIRVAVIARSPKIEPFAVTNACSSTTAANPTGLCAWDGSNFPAPTIDLSGTDANWLFYRYRAFETTIPFRNLIWSNGTF